MPDAEKVRVLAEWVGVPADVNIDAAFEYVVAKGGE